jgi:hypothetical protein
MEKPGWEPEDWLTGALLIAAAVMLLGLKQSLTTPVSLEQLLYNPFVVGLYLILAAWFVWRHF